MDNFSGSDTKLTLEEMIALAKQVPVSKWSSYGLLIGSGNLNVETSILGDKIEIEISKNILPYYLVYSYSLKVKKKAEGKLPDITLGKEKAVFFSKTGSSIKEVYSAIKQKYDLYQKKQGLESKRRWQQTLDERSAEKLAEKQAIPRAEASTTANIRKHIYHPYFLKYQLKFLR